MEENNGYIQYAGRLSQTVLRYSHHAMATIFEVVVVHDDAGYAEQCVYEAFRELDRIEQDLSRFIENSDISRINTAGANFPVLVGLDAFECIEQCAELTKKTKGAFDITVGPLFNCWKNADKTQRTPTERELTLARAIAGIRYVRIDREQFTVELEKNNMIFDLGGYGKGYAVDRMGEILREWDIHSALIHGGYSSVLALDPPPGEKGWLVTLSNPQDHTRNILNIYLNNRSVSGSGTRKGDHIINPRTGYPVHDKNAAWAVSQAAAVSDALSTAFMNMKPDEIELYCRENKGTQAIILPENTVNGEKLYFGEFDSIEHSH
ncbi:FAD:protein FMN transferase [candidate division KSB1 bacterium]